MFDGFGEALTHGGHGDLLDQLAEEATDDQAAGLVLGDAAGLQIEQLLVVETSGGTGVSGADDLAGLDLQVGHRVGAGAVGEHQVAVGLEGVGSGGLGADQHVADPHGVRIGLRRVRIALQRTLVRDMRAAVRLGMVDQQPRLEVLAVVGEVEAEQLGVAAGGVEPGRAVSRTTSPPRVTATCRSTASLPSAA